MFGSVQKVLAAYDNEWLLVNGNPERYRREANALIETCDALHSKASVTAGDVEELASAVGEIVAEHSAPEWLGFCGALLSGIRSDFGSKAQQIEAHLPGLLKRYRHDVPKTQGTLVALVALAGFQEERLRSQAGFLGRVFPSAELREAKEASAYAERILSEMWDAHQPQPSRLVVLPQPAPVIVTNPIGCPSYGGWTR